MRRKFDSSRFDRFLSVSRKLETKNFSAYSANISENAKSQAVKTAQTLKEKQKQQLLHKTSKEELFKKAKEAKAQLEPAAPKAEAELRTEQKKPVQSELPKQERKEEITNDELKDRISKMKDLNEKVKKEKTLDTGSSADDILSAVLGDLF